jgi:hypothetical protein
MGKNNWELLDVDGRVGDNIKIGREGVDWIQLG